MNWTKRRKQQPKHYATRYTDSDNLGNSEVKHLINQVCASKTLSRRQHLHLMTMLLANKVQDQGDRRRITQILDAARAGHLQVVN